MDKQPKDESKNVPCRLHAIVASKAKKAVVFRRGPSEWWHILEWDLQNYNITSGAWVKGRLYPRRSAISPDGKLMCYFMLKGDSFAIPDSKWNTFFAVSKVPWVTALAAWETCGTWTSGCWFDRNLDLNISGSCYTENGKPFHGIYPGKVNTNPTACVDWSKPDYLQEQLSDWQFINNEWISDNKQYFKSALPPEKQRWPKQPLAMLKTRSNDKAMLIILDFGFCSYKPNKYNNPIGGRTSDYFIRYESGNIEYLGHLRWADWDCSGVLLGATYDGCLCAYRPQDDDTLKCIKKHDLNNMVPEPVGSPSWAKKW